MFLKYLLYIVEFILLCGLTWCPVPGTEIIANTITLLSPNLTLIFCAPRRISFFWTASNEPSPVTTEQVKLWLIAEMKIIPLFFSQYDVFSDKFESAHFVHLRNIRLHRSYSTVQISLSLREIVWLDILMPSSFPMPARWFLGFTWPSFFEFSWNTINNTSRLPNSLWNIPSREFIFIM